MNLSDSERRLAVILGAVLLLLAIYTLFLRGSDVVADIPDAPVPTASVAPASPSGSPVFVVPPGSRDPFGGGSVPEA